MDYYIDLENCGLTELTEENLILLCQLNNIKPKKLTQLDLSWNKLTDLNCFNINTVFNNIKSISLSFNRPLKSLKNLEYLINLEYLNITGLEFTNSKETLNILKKLTKLEEITYINILGDKLRNILIKELKNVKIRS